MVSEWERGNTDSYIGKGNTVNKLSTKHRQANKYGQQHEDILLSSRFHCRDQIQKISLLGQSWGWTPKLLPNFWKEEHTEEAF